MRNQLPSLSTPDREAGLALASQLADRLHAQVEQSGIKEKWLGGMNYLPSKSIPKEVIGGILFYAIAAANQGWTSKTYLPSE